MIQNSCCTKAGWRWKYELAPGRDF